VGVPGVKLLKHGVVVAKRRHYVLSGIAAVVQWWGLIVSCHCLEDGGSSGCIWGERVRRKKVDVVEEGIHEKGRRRVENGGLATDVAWRVGDSRAWRAEIRGRRRVGGS
jgi:hypothetical protein